MTTQAGSCSPKGLFSTSPHASGRKTSCGVDRKSTRLNSSHGYISYAVFCLKKKNISLHTSACQREPQLLSCGPAIERGSRQLPYHATMPMASPPIQHRLYSTDLAIMSTLLA